MLWIFLQNALAFDLRPIVFFCGRTDIYEFGQRKDDRVALTAVRLWLESNHFSIERVIICTSENVDYDLYKGLISTIYFFLSLCHWQLYEGKSWWHWNECEKHCTDIKLGQSLSGLQINPNTGQDNELESSGERPQTNVGR